MLKDERRMYLHLYYNPEKRLEDEKALNRKLSKLQHELESGQRKADHESEYGRYFIVKETKGNTQARYTDYGQSGSN